MLGASTAGQVVGVSQTAEGISRAFIPRPNGMGMRDLGGLQRENSTALGINDAGQVAGMFSPAVGAPYAFITGPNGMGMRDLGTLGGGWAWGRGSGNGHGNPSGSRTHSTINEAGN